MRWLEGRGYPCKYHASRKTIEFVCSESTVAGMIQNLSDMGVPAHAANLGRRGTILNMYSVAIPTMRQAGYGRDYGSHSLRGFNDEPGTDLAFMKEVYLHLIKWFGRRDSNGFQCRGSRKICSVKKWTDCEVKEITLLAIGHSTPSSSDMQNLVGTLNSITDCFRAGPFSSRWDIDISFGERVQHASTASADVSIKIVPARRRR